MVVRGSKRCHVEEEKTNLKSKRCKLVVIKSVKVQSLLDISAKTVASIYPFQEIEECLGNVPIPVQERLMYHSFPQNEECIELYSSNKIHVNTVDGTKQPFQLGLKLLEQKSVMNVLQIGFHLSGVVHEKIGICNRQKIHHFKCSMTFDRNCITSTECTCNTKTLLWCPHIVAVALYRIRNPNSVPIKQPISDSIINLKQNQLQKLLLTLVSQHSNNILPSVQKLVDELREPDSEINLLIGIPDPTAGGCSEDDNTWHIDDENIMKKIQNDLKDGNPGKNIISLMNKVREMMSANDRNYLNLLKTITDTILSESIQNIEIQELQRTRKIYDELQALWFCVLFHPNLLRTTKQKLILYIKEWFKQPSCPKENADDANSRYILEDIINVLDKKDSYFTSSAKIEAFTTCKQDKDALNEAKLLLDSLRCSYTTFDDCNYFMKSTEPIFITFNTLLNNNYENEALELALIALSRSFSLPKGEYAQIRLTHRYERLISQLELFDYTNTVLQNTLIKYATKLYDNISTLIAGPIEQDILPNHCFVRFLFEHLLNIDSSLAFKLSLIVLPMNLNKGEDDDDEDISIDDGVMYNDTFCHIQSHLEYQQGELAACILKNCDKHCDYLKLTLTSILEDISQPTQLLKLAKLCQSIAVSEQVNVDILNAAFELGVRSIRIFTDPAERKACLRWLVSCAVDTGRQAVDFLIRNWTDLFEPKEITNDVAPILSSQPVVFHLRLNTLEKREELLSIIRNMVIEACIKDPVPCVLFALTLCEEHHESFELVCQITSESSDKFNTAQLFNVARYLESKKHLNRAFKIGVQALKKLDIGPLDCQHPAICDVLWISTLASNLGIDELTHVVPVIENCIHNPLLLTEIAERCSNKAYHNNKNTQYNFTCHTEPLNRLVASAQKLFIQDIELKLRTITRKNYHDFTKYLQKIKRSFLLSEDGQEQFHWLIDYIMTSQKGKKKLHEVITQAFAAKNTF